MKKLPNVYVGLVHHPIKSKDGKIVTTSVTNLDIHDISRSCKTFGVKKFFIITPLEEQKLLVNRILKFWKEGKALSYNPDRFNALKLAEVVDSIEDAISHIEAKDLKPNISVTGAHIKSNVSTSVLLNNLDKHPLFLLFGTGWGLTDTVIKLAKFRLPPLKGPGRYNHLSVRSAVAIYLDRLLSEGED